MFITEFITESVVCVSVAASTLHHLKTGQKKQQIKFCYKKMPPVGLQTQPEKEKVKLNLY